METRVQFISDKYSLEALFESSNRGDGVVITHPHPLYGGDMTNPVVESLQKVFRKKGFSTLRFNFRGVGRSEGVYDHGIGEQEDVLAGISYLKEQGKERIYLAGYSFGSWVLAQMNDFPEEVKAQLYVSLPVALLPLKPGTTIPLLKLLITGEDDEFAPAPLLEKSLPEWNTEARLKVLDFADHFYFGCFANLEAVVADFLAEEKG